MTKREFAHNWICVIALVLFLGLIGVFISLCGEETNAHKLSMTYLFVYLEAALLFSYVIVRPLLYYILNRKSHD